MKHLDWKQYKKIAREVAAEGCVLLKNDNQTLPVKKGEKISVFGRMQFDYYKSGTGSGGMVNSPYVVSILEGLKLCESISLNEDLIKVYKEWLVKNPFDIGEGWAKEPWCQKEMLVTKELVKEANKVSDIGIVIIGRTAGEDKDNSNTAGSYLLTEEEEKLIHMVCDTFERSAIILNTGNIMDMKWVEKYNPKAVLYTWQGGMEGGNSAADIITGKVTPSGKLSDTIAANIEDYPSTRNFGNEAVNYYCEDIYVGYRYFETIAKDKVLYPFGYGLSYTEFKTETISFHIKNNRIYLKVKVTNVGMLEGKETVQIYYGPPQGKLSKPIRNLIRFSKTKVLKPEEEETLSFEFHSDEMSSYDDGGYTKNKSCYVLESGKYNIFAGTNVREAVFVGEYCLNELRVTKQLSEAIAPVKEFKRIRLFEKESNNFSLEEETVPTRTIDLKKRMEKERNNAVYTEDKGYKLVDVYDNLVSMEEFLSQIPNEELLCITRGEGMCSPKVTPGTAAAFGGITEELNYFGIPTACCADGPSGIRMDCGTKAFSLPNGTLIACTFNTELVEELFFMLGMELRKNKVDTILGPGMNIHRNPLNGRNFEYFSEDPYLTGKMAAAELRALSEHKVTGTIKHFACNNQEFKRQDTDSVVSERALREIYLKGFEIAVKEGKAYSVMSTYGALNGIFTAGNYDLLTTILRMEWGFDGIVMTDWWAKINEEGEKASIQNTTAMVRAQNDVFMVTADAKENSCKDNTKEGLELGKITRGELLRNAANICNVIMKMPVMDRFIGRNKEEWEDQNMDFNMRETEKLKQSLTIDGYTELDVKNINTKKGDSVLYCLKIPEKGKYKVTLKLMSDSLILAQMPISIFANNQLVSTITINDTNKEWITKELEFDVYVSIDNYLKLFFGESGIVIGKISIDKIS